ncbi:MAG: hypothetical protein JWN70_5698 [Planctomycetaceae bacterium]|nr:hypothetical protein [Planctomycetaceae bacterium]
MRLRAIPLTVCLIALAAFAVGDEPLAPSPAHVAIPATGTVDFKITPDEPQVAERFRMQNHQFPYTTKLERMSGEVQVTRVTFPSPVTTEFEENNTVHGLYFQPSGKGPFPGVVVLHILGGDFILSQTIANALARNGVAALAIKMPYYAERRRPGHPRRLLSRNLEESIAGMTQAVLDIRQSVAWIRDRPEVADDDLGITGISLGGLMSALSAAAEPRVRKVGIQLAGGDLAQSIWDQERKETAGFREDWLSKGGTRESFIKAVAPVEPTTYSHLLKGRKVLMLAARQDEIFPVSSTLALWKSMGEEPELIWLEDTGHYTALLYIMRETERLSKFMKQPLPERKESR